MDGCRCWMCAESRFRSIPASAPPPLLVQVFSDAADGPRGLN